MNKTSLTTLPAALALALTLGACGGGDDPVPGPGPQPQPVVGPFITDCFKVDKAITFALATSGIPPGAVGANKSTVEPTTYDSKPAMRQTFFYPAATKTYTETNYWTVTSSGVTFVAKVNTDGTVTPRNMFYPIDIATDKPITDSDGVKYTFKGFETITLDSKKFSNACHMKEEYPDGNSAEIWYAQGYGVIKQADTQGVIVEYRQ